MRGNRSRRLCYQPRSDRTQRRRRDADALGEGRWRRHAQTPAWLTRVHDRRVVSAAIAASALLCAIGPAFDPYEGEGEEQGTHNHPHQTISLKNL